MTTKTEPLNVELFKLAGLKYFNGTSVSSPDWPLGYWSESEFFKRKYKEVPDFHEDCQLMLDWLVPIMRERGYGYQIIRIHKSETDSMSLRFFWQNGPKCHTYKIIHDNVALAACQSAIPILRELAKEKGCL